MIILSLASGTWPDQGRLGPKPVLKQGEPGHRLGFGQFGQEIKEWESHGHRASMARPGCGWPRLLRKMVFGEKSEAIGSSRPKMHRQLSFTIQLFSIMFSDLANVCRFTV